MKVILTDEVSGLGGRGDVVSVKDGYARNYLIPKQKAREATDGNLRAAEHERMKWAALTTEEVSAARELAAQLTNLTVVVYKRAGAEGTLFGSVTSADIAEALAEKGFHLDKRRIDLRHPIKRMGLHEVEAAIHREVNATIKVDIHPLGDMGTVASFKAAPTEVAPVDAVAEASVPETAPVVDAAPEEAPEASAEQETTEEK